MIRLENQAAGTMPTTTVRIPPMAVMYSSALRNPWDSDDSNSLVHVHVDVAHWLVRGQVEYRLAMPVQVGCGGTR